MWSTGRPRVECAYDGLLRSVPPSIIAPLRYTTLQEQRESVGISV